MSSAPAAIIAAPSDLAALLPSGLLKLDQVSQLLMLQADLTLALTDEPSISALMTELPKDIARTVSMTAETEHVTAFAKSYMKRPRRVGDDVLSDGSAPLSLQYVLVSAGSRTPMLRRVLDAVNAPSTIIVAPEDAQVLEAQQALRALGYDNEQVDVKAVGGAVDTHSGLRVLFDVPPTRAALDAATGGAPAQVIALVTPRQVAHLRSLLAGGSLTYFVLPDTMALAIGRDGARLGELRKILAEGVSARELAALEPLLDESDALEIAAAALRLLERERETAKALRIGVTTAQPKEVKRALAITAQQNDGAVVPIESLAPDAAPSRAVRQDAPRSDAPRGESSRSTSTRSDSSRSDSSRSDSARTESARTESARVEPARAESTRSEFVRSESPRAGSPPPEFQVIWLNIGNDDGATASSFVGAITGETGLDRSVVGSIDLHDSHTLVEVSGAHAEQIIAAMNASTMRNRQVIARIDRVGPMRGSIASGSRGGPPRRGASGGGSDRAGGARGGFSRDRGERPSRPSFGRGDAGDAPRERTGYPRRDEGDRPRSGGFSRDDRPARAPRAGGFSRDDRPARPPREGGFSRDDRPARPPREGGFSRDDRPARSPGFSRDERPARAPFSRDDRTPRPPHEGGGGFSRDDRSSRPPREGGGGGGSSFPRAPREGGFPRAPREGGFPRAPRESGFTRTPREGGFARPSRDAGAPTGRGFTRDRGDAPTGPRTDNHDFAERAERLRNARKPRTED